MRQSYQISLSFVTSKYSLTKLVTGKSFVKRSFEVLFLCKNQFIVFVLEKIEKEYSINLPPYGAEWFIQVSQDELHVMMK